MSTEIEATFTDIDKVAVRAKLKALNATLIYPERLMRRRVFDFPDGRLRKYNGWVRVRDEGDRVTLSYKRLLDRTLDGMKETMVTVDDFDQTCELLQDIGLTKHTYQESKRELWTLNKAEISIDSWPWIPTIVEIEVLDEQSVKQVARLLGFNWSQARFGSVENIYRIYYDVSDQEIYAWKEAKFRPVPDWLEKKRRQ